MNFWNLIGLPCKKDYQNIVSAANAQTEQCEQIFAQMEEIKRANAEQQQLLHAVITKEFSDLHAQIAQIQQKNMEWAESQMTNLAQKQDALFSTVKDAISDMEEKSSNEQKELLSQLERSSNALKNQMSECRTSVLDKLNAYITAQNSLRTELLQGLQEARETSAETAHEITEQIRDAVSGMEEKKQ